MEHGVFINQRKASCSIYESGLMIKDILRGFSKEYTLDYVETDENLSGLDNYPYAFYVINWHAYTLPIKKHLLDRLKAPKIAVVLEVSKDEYLPFNPDWFDAYAIIDPTKEKKERFFPLPRPILDGKIKPTLKEDKLVLGSFGLFSYQNREEKRFDEIVIEAGKIDKECIVRLNLPTATFTYTTMEEIGKYCRYLRSLVKPNVDLRITHNYMERGELISWLSEHDMNCFPYYRERPGLSAVTDQAISAGRAIMTTECNTFRHLHQYINYYPKQSYEELISTSLKGVRKMQSNWSPEKFREQFDLMLKELGVI